MKRDKELCGARTRKGTPCQAKVLASGRCRLHGGAAPAALTKRARDEANIRAHRALVHLGQDVAPVTDAVAELESLAGECVALKNALRGAVASLDSVSYDTEHSSSVRGEIQAYQAQLERTESVLSNILKHDLDQRRLQLDERTEQAALTAMLFVLKKYLDPSEVEQAQELVGRKLRELGQ